MPQIIGPRPSLKSALETQTAKVEPPSLTKCIQPFYSRQLRQGYDHSGTPPSGDRISMKREGLHHGAAQEVNPNR